METLAGFCTELVTVLQCWIHILLDMCIVGWVFCLKAAFFLNGKLSQKWSYYERKEHLWQFWRLSNKSQVGPFFFRIFFFRHKIKLNLRYFRTIFCLGKSKQTNKPFFPLTITSLWVAFKITYLFKLSSTGCAQTRETSLVLVFDFPLADKTCCWKRHFSTKEKRKCESLQMSEASWSHRDRTIYCGVLLPLSPLFPCQIPI